jgi:MGT family glycosyltransferase
VSRFLFFITGLTIHVGAALSVASELEARGHVVAWVAPTAIHHLLPSDAVVYPVRNGTAARSTGSWTSDVKSLYEQHLIPLARATLGDVDYAIDDFSPTALAVDEHALAASLAARRRRLPWATLVRSAAIAYEGQAPLPSLATWINDQFADLQREAGLEPLRRPHLSPQLVISFSTRELIGEDLAFPDHYRFVGPALEHRSATPDADGFPWEALGDCPRVLVSLGTTAIVADRSEHFYRVACEALGGRDLQAIVVAPAELVPNPPPNVLVRSHVPQLTLLPHVEAVVCHAGHNTVLEALAHGLPLVVAPFTFDQPLVAEQVVRCGAGIRVHRSRVRADELASAVNAVLTEPGYREAARRIRASFGAAGGTAAAADALEAL